MNGYVSHSRLNSGKGHFVLFHFWIDNIESYVVRSNF